MHLLVRETRGLDEAEAAVDLGQSRADLVFLSFSDSDLGALAASWSAQGASCAVAPPRQSCAAPPPDVGRSLCRAGDRGRALRRDPPARRPRLLALWRRGDCPRRAGAGHSAGAAPWRRPRRRAARRAFHRRWRDARAARCVLRRRRSGEHAPRARRHGASRWARAGPWSCRRASAHAWRASSRRGRGAGPPARASSCSTAPICSPPISRPSRLWRGRSSQEGLNVRALYVASLKDRDTGHFVASTLARLGPADRAQRHRLLGAPRRCAVASRSCRRADPASRVRRIEPRSLAGFAARAFAIGSRHAGGAARARRAAAHHGDLLQGRGERGRRSRIRPRRASASGRGHRRRCAQRVALGAPRHHAARGAEARARAVRLSRRGRASRPRSRPRRHRQHRRDPAASQRRRLRCRRYASRQCKPRRRALRRRADALPLARRLQAPVRDPRRRRPRQDRRRVGRAGRRSLRPRRLISPCASRATAA